MRSLLSQPLTPCSPLLRARRRRGQRSSRTQSNSPTDPAGPSRSITRRMVCRPASGSRRAGRASARFLAAGVRDHSGPDLSTPSNSTWKVPPGPAEPRAPRGCRSLRAPPSRCRSATHPPRCGPPGSRRSCRPGGEDVHLFQAAERVEPPSWGSCWSCRGRPGLRLLIEVLRLDGAGQLPGRPGRAFGPPGGPTRQDPSSGATTRP